MNAFSPLFFSLLKNYFKLCKAKIQNEDFLLFLSPCDKLRALKARKQGISAMKNYFLGKQNFHSAKFVILLSVKDPASYFPCI